METTTLDINLLIKGIIILSVCIMIVMCKGQFGYFGIKTKYGNITIGKKEEEEEEEISEEEGNKKNFTGFSNYTTMRELNKLIYQTSTSISKQVLDFIIKNDIAKKTSKEMSEYIEEKLEYITNFYNNALSKSDILKNYSMDKILNGETQLSIKNYLHDAYMDIYYNHLDSAKKQKEWIQMHKQDVVTKELMEEYKKFNEECLKHDYHKVIITRTSINKAIINSFEKIKENANVDA